MEEQHISVVETATFIAKAKGCMTEAERLAAMAERNLLATAAKAIARAYGR
jgi:hypothetical protein